jgi:hypothetical protein
VTRRRVLNWSSARRGLLIVEVLGEGSLVPPNLADLDRHLAASLAWHTTKLTYSGMDGSHDVDPHLLCEEPAPSSSGTG